MGNPVEAIRTFRNEFGCGLLEAKAMWDRYGSLEAMRTAAREGGIREPDSVRADRLERELEALGRAIATAAQRAGIYNGEVGLTGPDLIQLCDDLGSGFIGERPAAGTTHPFSALRAKMSPESQARSAALALALLFHEAYERLAPSYGYETRQETREFDPESKNGRLMVAVCAELLNESPTKDSA